jgi:membrane protease YdiL (CAAX protease family)
MSGAGIEAPPAARPEAARPPSPWTLSDIALSLPLTVVLWLALGFGLVTTIIPLLPQHDHDLRTSVSSFVVSVSFYAGVVGSVLGLVTLHRRAPVSALGWRAVSLRWVTAAIPLAAAAYLLVVLVGGLQNALLPADHCGQARDVLRAYPHNHALAVIVVALVAPAAEETFFRGFLYGWLRGRLPPWSAVAVSALVFGLAHLQPVVLLPLFLLGCVLAIVYERSGSLLPGMAVHSVFNLVGITLIFSTHC